MEYAELDSLKNKLNGLVEAMEKELRQYENCVSSILTKMYDDGMEKMLRKDIQRIKSVLGEVEQ